MRKNTKSMAQTRPSTRSWKKTKEKNTHMDIRNIQNDKQKNKPEKKISKPYSYNIKYSQQRKYTENCKGKTHTLHKKEKP